MTPFEQLVATLKEGQAVFRAFRDQLRAHGPDPVATAAKETRLRVVNARLSRLARAGVMRRLKPAQRLWYTSFYEQISALHAEIDDLHRARPGPPPDSP